MANNPLSTAGYPVNPETGLPEYISMNLRQKEKEARYNNLIAEGAEVINELSDDRGLIVREAVRLFIDRVNVLIAADPQCQVFDALFQSIRLKIDAGNAIAKGRTNGFLKV